MADKLNTSQLFLVFLPVEARQSPALWFAVMVSQFVSLECERFPVALRERLSSVLE